MNEKDFQRTDERLRNWGRWSRSGSTVIGTCASAERYYVAPRPDAVMAQQGAVVPCDQRDAVTVDQAVIKLNPNQRCFVTEVYVWRAESEKLIRLFKLSPGAIGDTRKRVIALIHRQLGDIDLQAEIIRARRREEPKFAFYKITGV